MRNKEVRGVLTLIVAFLTFQSSFLKCFSRLSIEGDLCGEGPI